MTVYIPSHNYARFLPQAVESVLSQTLKDWELIVIDDGSTDDTQSVLGRYAGHPRIRILQQERKGLNVTNNIALRLANARYLMRLDADDYLDENALLVMSHVLDSKPEVGLVYPDYWLVDEQGEVLKLVRRKKIGAEAQLLDLPAHGACTMIRKECLLELGGYSEAFACQDGYDLWLRFVQRFRPYNVNIPLFYYRQHGSSLTRDERRVLVTRAAIKRRFVRERRGGRVPKVLGLIPIARLPADLPDSPFARLAGRPLLRHTVEAALAAHTLDRIAVSSNDPAALAFARRYARRGVVALERPDSLVRSGSPIAATASHALKRLAAERRYRPEAVMLLYINCPLRRPMHIDMAVDAMAIFDVDSVVSVTEELAYCYHHGRRGLEPLQKSRELHLERKGLYKENGAVLLAKTGRIDPAGFVGGSTGHIVMLPEESVRIKNRYDLWLADRILTDWLPRDKAALAARA